MKDKIRSRIQKLDEVGQQSFNGTDYTFGFDIWKSGTITLLRRIFPEEKDLIEQIQNIELIRTRHDRADALAYNLVSCKNEAKEILEIFLDTINETMNNHSQDFWSLLHPRIVYLAQTRFENQLYADSVSVCLREINSIVKDHVRKAISQELDGATLMTKAFSAANPIICFGDLSTENGRNIQLGYMKIFEGAMIGIRNPKAHANLYPDGNKTIHLLFLASFMMNKLQEAGILDNE